MTVYKPIQAEAETAVQAAIASLHFEPETDWAQVALLYARLGELAPSPVVELNRAVAVAMAGQLVAVTPEKVGRSVRAGQSCATIESGKWVGPARSAAAGDIVAVNETVVGKPSTANADPYGDGWLVVLKPANWDAVKRTLVSGADMATRYEAKMAADNFPGCA